MTTATGTITLMIPLSLAPLSLSKNGRAHWRVQRLAFREQREYAMYELLCQGARDQAEPWPAAVMHVEWQYHTGRPPDSDNVVARLAAVRDAFQDVGVVDDDRHIRIGRVTFTRIPRSDDPCAVVTLERG